MVPDKYPNINNPKHRHMLCNLILAILLLLLGNNALNFNQVKTPEHENMKTATLLSSDQKYAS